MRAGVLVTFVHCCVPSTLNIAQHMVGLMLAGELCFFHALMGEWAQCCQNISVLREVTHLLFFSKILISKCSQLILTINTWGVQ